VITSTGVRLREEPYLIINLVLSSVLLLVFIYSGLFSPEKDNYPIVCIHEKITGEPCPSCGLSHSFSLMVRGRIPEAYNWNLYGPRVFVFFAAQLVMRMLFSVFWLKNPGTRRELILYDIGGSIILFAVSFLPFFVNIIRSLDVILQ
jgi:hypothetical protein